MVTRVRPRKGARLRAWARSADTYFRKGTTLRRSLYAMPRAAINIPTTRRRAEVARRCRPTAPLVMSRDAGYVELTRPQFPELVEAIEAAQGLIAATDPAQHVRSKEQLITQLLDPGELTLDSPYMRLALRPDILSCASAYLGVVPILSTVDVWFSRWTGEDALQNSQLFHLDWGDTSQVKLFVLCSDVEARHGPLVFIDAERSERLRKALSYAFDGERGRVPDERVEAVLGASAAQSLVGRAGDATLIDTSRCFHQGSRVLDPDATRTVIMIQYLTPTAFALPLRPLADAPFRHLARADMTEIEQLVLGAR